MTYFIGLYKFDLSHKAGIATSFKIAVIYYEGQALLIYTVSFIADLDYTLGVRTPTEIFSIIVFNCVAENPSMLG